MYTCHIVIAANNLSIDARAHTRTHTLKNMLVTGFPVH